MNEIELNQNVTEQVPFGVQHNLPNIKPTSSEINHLWVTYMAESMSAAMLKHMVAKSKDPDFHSVLQLVLDASSQNINAIGGIFETITHPIPEAFGERDVNINAPELFSEEFSVRYTKLMQKYILTNYTLAFSDCSRSDIKDLFSRFIDTSKTIIHKIDEVLLAKGLFQKSPYIDYSQVNFVHDKKYYGSLFHTKDRPLNAVEINNIFNIIEFKTAMRALKLGFAQVAKSDQVREHLNQGLSMAEKQLKILNSLLEKDGLPKPEILDDRVTDSTQAPYSDKLIMFHTSVAMGRIILAYGLGLTNSSRKDIIVGFTRLTAEILEFSKKGVDIMIENGWLEEVPAAANRNALTRLKH